MRTREHRNAMLSGKCAACRAADDSGRTGPEDADADHRASADGQAGSTLLDRHRIAVLVPCYNEEAAIAEVVDALPRRAARRATIYVYDNNSTDRTVEIARAAGAVVRRETPPGQGLCGAAHVRRRRRRHLRAGRRRRDLRRAERARHDRAADRRAARHGGGRARRPRGGGLPARPPHRQPAAHRLRARTSSASRSATCCRATGCSRAAS